MATRTRNREELIDLTTRTQDWDKMCRGVCRPEDYLEEHTKKRERQRRRWRQNMRKQGGRYMRVYMEDRWDMDSLWNEQPEKVE